MKNKSPSKVVKRHHRFVKRLQLTLTTFAVMIAALLLLWPQLAKQRDFIDSLFKQQINFSRDASVDMANVEFFSQDKKGQPFTVTSEKVLETDPAQKLVKLDNPIGKMTLNSGVKVFSSSPFALFYQDKEILVFQEKVKVTTDNGYEADLLNVTLNHKEESAQSPSSVTIDGPKGSLDAQGFNLYDNGDKIDFLGKSKLVIKDDKKKRTFVITSTNGIDVRQTAKTIKAKGDATLIEEVNKVYADEMTAFLRLVDKDKYEVERIEAKGHVKIVTPNETVTGDAGLYNVDQETATVTRNVRIERDGGEMRGAKATVDMRTGVSQMHGAADGNLPGRVRGILLPSQMKKDKVK